MWDESYILNDNSKKEGHYSVFFQSENLLEIFLLKNKLRCWQLWKLYFSNISMLKYILEKQLFEKLWRIAERPSEQTECSDISFLEYHL